MESQVKVEAPVSETAKRLSCLSIIVDDFDCDTSHTSSPQTSETNAVYQPTPRPYTRQSSDAMIQKILEEAESRKHEFWKLIDEHNAVVENLKKMEQLENNACCKVAPVSAVLRT